MNPPFLHTLGTSPSPDLFHVQASSISDSVADDQWRLSPSDQGKASLPATLDRSHGMYLSKRLITLCVGLSTKTS